MRIQESDRFTSTVLSTGSLAMTVPIKQKARQYRMKPGYIYILTNKTNSTLYVGVTANLKQRIQQHKDRINKKAFTYRYNIDKLVYYEVYQMIGDAIGREKQLKAGNRAKKIALIEKDNPEWLDLFDTL
jgi:putative endonuclease